MRQRIFRLLLSASFERSSFSRIQPGFAFSKNCDVLEYMENFSGIGPGGHKPKNDSRTAKTPTAPEPAGHEEDGNSRGIRKKSRPSEGSKAGTSAAERRCDHRRDRQSDWLAKPHHPGVPQRACCEEDGARREVR